MTPCNFTKKKKSNEGNDTTDWEVTLKLQRAHFHNLIIDFSQFSGKKENIGLIAVMMIRLDQF